MAHYALIDSNNKVVQVITGVDENITQIDSDGTEVGGTSEAWEMFYASRPWFDGLKCKRTSYNAAENGFRKNFAGIDYTYDSHFDAFIAPQPYASWKLNYTTFQWEAPNACPEEIDGYFWMWSEYNKEWISVAK
jgi:hypothetical protein